MTFRDVPIGTRFILHTEVKGGHGPFRKLSATKVVGSWTAVTFKMRDLDALIEECYFCGRALVTDDNLAATPEAGATAARRIACAIRAGRHGVE